MLNQDYITRILNLEDVIITNVENISTQIHIHLELPQKKHVCPSCGALTDTVHDYRSQVSRMFPLAEKPICICESDAIAASVGSGSLKRTSFCLAIIELQAGS